LPGGRLRNKHEALVAALTGGVGAHQRFLLAIQLRHLADLDELIEGLDAEIEERLRPAEPVIERLATIPGVGRRLAEVLIAEIAQDLSRFGSSRHLASWAGICTGNYERADTHHGGKTRRGSPWLRSALVSSAQFLADPDVSRRTIPPPGREAGCQARVRGRRPNDPRDRLCAPDQRRADLRSRHQLFRSAGRRSREAPTHPSS
jgi:hypothetical protein